MQALGYGAVSYPRFSARVSNLPPVSWLSSRSRRFWIIFFLEKKKSFEFETDLDIDRQFLSLICGNFK